MAIKGDRFIETDDIGWSCDMVAEQGLFVVRQNFPSGAALGAEGGKVTVKADPSGSKPVGVLFTNVVNTDTSKFHLNWYREEVSVNEKVRVMRKGWYTTNNVIGTPDHGDTAYLTVSGFYTPTMSATGGLAATPKVGQFGGKKDADGYVRVEINLPVI